MSDLLRLVKRMGIRRKYIFLLILRSPFDAFRTWMLAGLMKAVFLCLETDDTDRLLTVCIIYGLMCTLLFFYNGTIWSIYAAFAARIEARLQKMMLEKMMDMPYGRVDRHFSGEWVTRLNSDVQAAYTMMNGPLNIPHMVVAVINTVLSSLLMLRSSVPLLVVTWLFILPSLFMNDRIVLRHMLILKEASQKAMAESTSAIKPLITEAETILLYDASEMMMKKCEESSRRLMKINMSMHMRNALSSAVLRLFGCGGYLVILLMGHHMIGSGRMAFSDLVYCFQVRGSVLAGMFMLLTCLNHIRANSVCIKRMNDTLEG